MNNPMKPFAVNLWGSHPDDGNDDCHTGADFATLDEAVEVFDTPERGFSPLACRDYAYVELDGPGVNWVRHNADHVERADDDSDWRREQAMQAGMGGGCEAYNEAMGWD